jgi:hypothetical protein
MIFAPAKGRVSLCQYPPRLWLCPCHREFAFANFTPRRSLHASARPRWLYEPWNDPGSCSHGPNLRFSGFGNGLAPRSYRFLVRAINADGAVTAEPAEVEFAILPPFWQRWWFVTVLLAAWVYALHYYRVTKLLELERMRIRIATDLHDALDPACRVGHRSPARPRAGPFAAHTALRERRAGRTRNRKIQRAGVHNGGAATRCFVKRDAR